MTTPTLTTTTTESSLLPTYFTPPRLGPAPGGLWAATTWTDELADTPPRWLTEGVVFRASETGNFGGHLSTGVWDRPWCDWVPGSGSGDDAIKTGVRPADSDPFYPVVCWGYDECDLLAVSRPVVVARAQQALGLQEPVLLARDLGYRMADDAAAGNVVGGVETALTDLKDAVGRLDAWLADANVIGMIHLSPFLAEHLAHRGLILRSGVGWTTQFGHRAVIDGGYSDSLGEATIVATSPVFGWRARGTVAETVDALNNRFIVVAERASLVGYEALVGAVTLDAGSI